MKRKRRLRNLLFVIGLSVLSACCARKPTVQEYFTYDNCLLDYVIQVRTDGKKIMAFPRENEGRGFVYNCKGDERIWKVYTDVNVHLDNTGGDIIFTLKDSEENSKLYSPIFVGETNYARIWSLSDKKSFLAINQGNEGFGEVRKLQDYLKN